MQAQTDAARAAFYPNINLVGLVGLQSLGLNQLLDHGAVMGTAGPALNLPLFDGGRRAGQYTVARAQADLAITSYNATLVQALREVAATVSQLRLKDGFLAFVLDRVQALSFIPIPDQLLTYLVQKAPPGLLTYYREDRIMVVNLNDWMPAGVDLSLERTEFEEGALTLHFAQGSYDLAGLLERVTRIDD